MKNQKKDLPRVNELKIYTAVCNLFTMGLSIEELVKVFGWTDDAIQRILRAYTKTVTIKD